MNWLVTALLLVWLVPILAVAGAALVYRFSDSFRGWLDEVLFGESLSAPSGARAMHERAVRALKRR